MLYQLSFLILNLDFIFPKKKKRPQWEIDFERQFYQRGLYELDYDDENLIDVYDEVLQFIRSIKK